MKKTKILYWIFTGLFSAMMLFSAIPDVLVVPDAVKFMTMLGYPVYFIPFIGVAKILGVIAILVPGAERMKEWAYAGLAYDLIGATYSCLAIGTPVLDCAPILIWIGIGVCSYVFWRKKTRMEKDGREV